MSLSLRLLFQPTGVNRSWTRTYTKIIDAAQENLRTSRDGKTFLARTEENQISWRLSQAAKTGTVISLFRCFREWTESINNSNTPWDNVDVCLAVHAFRSVDLNNEPDALQLAVAIMNKSQPQMVIHEKLLTCLVMGISKTRFENANDNSREIILPVLDFLANKMKTSAFPSDPISVSTALYAMQGKSSEPAEVRRYLGAITSKLVRMQQQEQQKDVNNKTPKLRLNAQHIANILYGMKDMSAYDKEVLELVQALRPFVVDSVADRPGGLYSGQVVANCCFGLQGMLGNRAEVCAFVDALADKIVGSEKEQGQRQVNEVMNGQMVAMSLHGLQNMNNRDHPAVRKLIGALATRIMVGTTTATSASDARNDAFFTARGVNMALYGLRSMRCRADDGDIPLRSLLTALTRRIELTNNDNDRRRGRDGRGCVLEGQDIGHALHGLCNMSSEVAEVRALVSALTQLISYSFEAGVRFNTPYDVCDALFGLKHMSSEHPEVQQLVTVLTQLINASSGRGQVPQLSGFAVGIAVYSTRFLRCEDACTLPLLRVLRDRINASTASGEAERVHMNFRAVKNAFFGLERKSCQDFVEVRDLYAALLPHIAHADLSNKETLQCILWVVQNHSGTTAEIQDVYGVLLQRLKKTSKHFKLLNEEERDLATVLVREMEASPSWSKVKRITMGQLNST